MKDRYRIVDKFLFVSTVLDPDGTDEDMKSFISLKKIRNNMFHKFDMLPDHLRIEDVKTLFVKYLKLHLRGSRRKGAWHGDQRRHPGNRLSRSISLPQWLNPNRSGAYPGIRSIPKRADGLLHSIGDVNSRE